MAFSGPASGSLVVSTRFTTAIASEVPVALPGGGFAVGGGGAVSVLDADGGLVTTIIAPAGPAGSSATVNSLVVAGDILAIAIGYTDNATQARLPGAVVFHDAATFAVLGSVTVGANPDNIVASPDGSTLLVANEGEPNSYGQANSVDPEGSVSIIDLAGGAAAATVRTATFTAFNGQADALKAAGVRLFGPGATVAQDLEPEYIWITPDGATALVTLQENNAIAVVDIASAAVTNIVPLGYKDHSLAGQGLDASDRDGPGNTAAINIATWPIFGMYQPDAIAGFTFNGQTYIATANEGDARDYGGFGEEVRVRDLTLDPTVFPNAAALQQNANLGRLTVTDQLGDTDNDGDFDALYAFGARSFSIWNAAGTLVWDSGDAIEQAIAALDPNWAEPTAAQRGTVDGLGDDTRSDAKGPEPEHIAFGTIGEDLYAFVGLERANGIMLFRLDEAGATPSFTYQGIIHTQGDVAPEVFQVIDAGVSASGNTELLVANEVSGTTTLYEIEPAIMEPDYFTLQILHISDQEAGLQAPGRMGNAAAIFDRLEDDATVDASITLSPGDAWIPGPFYAAEADPSIEAALEAFYGVNLPSGAQISGRVSLAFLNAIEADAASFGNHEFDLGTNPINAIITPSGAYPGAQFPYLSANLDFSADTAAIGGNLAARVTADGQEASAIKGRIAGTAVVTQGEEKIGLVAATTQILRSISSPGAVEVIGPDANDMPALAAILQPKIDALVAQGINKIVLMSHLQQYQLEEALVPLLKGVDVVIAAGSHALFADQDDILRPGDTPVEDYPIWTSDADGKDVLIVSTPNEFAYVGRLQVQFDANGDVVKGAFDSAKNGVIATTDEGVASVYGADIGQAFAAGSKGARVDALADAVQAVIGAQDGTTFGFADVFLDGKRIEVRRQETNLGNLTADANLAEARKTDASVLVSIKNGGGIRDSIGSVVGTPVAVEGPTLENPAAGKEAGEVSQLDITNSLRFNNTLSLVTLTADGLLKVLEHGVSTLGASNTPGQFPQVGGVNFSFDISRPPGDRIVNATIVDEDGNILDVLARDGSLVGDAAREIRIVTLNFLAGGGDGYPFPTLGTDRVDLVRPGVRDGVATFADNGTEQDALAEFLAANHATREAAFGTPDTDIPLDTRIQQLAAREDAVEPVLDFDLFRASANNSTSVSSWQQVATNLDYVNATVAGQQSSSAATDSTGAKVGRFLSGDGDVAIRSVDFAGGASTNGFAGLSLDWQGRDAVLALEGVWNSIQNIRLNGFTGDSLTVQKVASVVAFFRPDGDAQRDLDYDLLVQGAKRTNLITADGNDRIVVEVDSDGGPIAQNQVVITTNAGDDVVEVKASAFNWTGAFSPAPYDPLWTRSVVNLGDGDDTFLGGDGQDVVTGGAGDDVMDGRGGFDQAIFAGSRGAYTVTIEAGVTTVAHAAGTDTLTNFEQLRFDDAVLNLRGGIWA
jgi:2',3'-cyclic-nucleotide 2'-phosphodiesterase (5'-nucleotidase family)